MSKHQQPVTIDLLRMDGTFTVAEGHPTSLKTKKMIFFDKTLYKLVYKGDGMQGFYARGVKSYDNMLLLHVIDDDGRELLFAYSSDPDPSTDPKILDVDASKTSWSRGVKVHLPGAKQVLLTPESLVLLESRTSIGGFASAIRYSS